jgi:hypothetical protein
MLAEAAADALRSFDFQVDGDIDKAAIVLWRNRSRESKSSACLGTVTSNSGIQYRLRREM